MDDPSVLLADTDETALIQVIRYLNPVVIVDESHHATSDLSVEMLQNFNPSFVFDPLPLLLLLFPSLSLVYS